LLRLTRVFNRLECKESHLKTGQALFISPHEPRSHHAPHFRKVEAVGPTDAHHRTIGAYVSLAV